MDSCICGCDSCIYSVSGGVTSGENETSSMFQITIGPVSSVECSIWVSLHDFVQIILCRCMALHGASTLS